MKAYVAALFDLPCELSEPQSLSQNRRAVVAYADKGQFGLTQTTHSIQWARPSDCIFSQRGLAARLSNSMIS